MNDTLKVQLSEKQELAHEKLSEYNSKILEKMSEDNSSDIRYRVAINDSTPKNILDKLAKDKDKDVREAIKERS